VNRAHRRAAAARPASAAQVYRVARALIDTVVGDYHCKKADRQFLALAAGVDRNIVVRHGVAIVQARLGTRLRPDQIEAELRRQLTRIFSAKSLAAMPVRGSA
jgi:hypothetical protein